MLNPIDAYEVFHKLDRPYQQETADKLLEKIADPDIRVVVVKGETGSGKTAWIAHVSKYYRTMALTFTKSLQDQYARYGFVPLFGLSNYECTRLSRDHTKIHAGTCTDLTQGSRPCADYSSGHIYKCPYRTWRDRAVRSNRVVLNVSKALIDKSIRTEQVPNVIAIDECHLLSDYLINFGGYTFQWETDFYSIDPQKFEGIGIHETRVRNILSYMQAQLNDNTPPAPTDVNDSNLKLIKQWESLMSKVDVLLENIDTSYYFEANNKELIIKPLSPEGLFHKFFALHKDRTIILMSATPGRPEHIAKTFGILEHELAYVEGKDIYTPEQKQIKVLSAPAMTNLFVPKYDKDRVRKLAIVEEKRQKHAQVIASEILSYPEWYQGLITVTSYAMADDLVHRLKQLGILCFVPPRGTGTDRQLKYTRQMLQEKNGTKPRYRAVISCTFNEGVDFGELQFVIMGKTPFPYIGDKVSKARRQYDNLWYMITTSQTVKQILGRNQREDAHFAPGAHKVVVIADGSYTAILPYCEDSFIQRLVVMNKNNLPSPKKGKKLVVKG